MWGLHRPAVTEIVTLQPSAVLYNVLLMVSYQLYKYMAVSMLLYTTNNCQEDYNFYN